MLIFLSDDSVGAELKRVIANDLRNSITKCVSWIGIVPRNVSGIFFESAVSRIACDFDTRKLAAEIGEQTGHGHGAGTGNGAWSSICQRDVVGGVAEDKFIEERWIDGRG